MFFGPSLIAFIRAHANGCRGNGNCNDTSNDTRQRFDVLYLAFGCRTATGFRFELTSIEYDEVVDNRGRLRTLAAAAFKDRALGAFQRRLLQHGVSAQYLRRFNASIRADGEFQLHVTSDSCLAGERRIERRGEFRQDDTSLGRLGGGLSRR